MRVKIDFAGLQKTKWHEYAVRFIFGGAVTAIAGIVAKAFGPVFGGLFLACPAIFPASATLIEKHEKEKKARAGLNGAKRGRKAASADATGAAIGSIGLMVFGLISWKLVQRDAMWLTLGVATLAWLTVSVLLWTVRKRFMLTDFLPKK